MIANLVEIKCLFFKLDYYCHHFGNHVIGTFQDRALNYAFVFFCLNVADSWSIYLSHERSKIIYTLIK